MSFPRAGRICAAQILAELGSVRERFDSDEHLAAEAGVAPVTYASGKSKAVTFRWACNHRLRAALTCLADNSRHANAWAASVYAKARARGCDHPHAIRILVAGLAARHLARLDRSQTLRPQPTSRRSNAASNGQGVDTGCLMPVRSRSPRREPCGSRRHRACGAGCGRAPRSRCFPLPRPSRRGAPRAVPWTAPCPGVPASAASSANSRGERSTAAPSRVTVRAPRIERDVAVREHVVPARDVAAQDRPHPRRELVEAEGLDEVVVGARIEPGDTVGHRVARRDDQNAHLVACTAQVAQQLEAALPRQSEVEQHQRVRIVGGVERNARRLPVLHPVDRIAVLLQGRVAASCRSWGRLRPEGCACPPGDDGGRTREPRSTRLSACPSSCAIP